MANTPDKPPDDGKIGLPRVGAGMNKIAPKLSEAADDKGLPKPKETERETAEKILRRMRKRFDRCVAAEAENRKEMLDDKKFIVGEAQWPAAVAAQRNFDQRPLLTINKLPTFINQVVNDLRMNRPMPEVSPTGDRGDKDAAKIYRGMLRAIERESRADIAYDTAAYDAVCTGLGYFRILTEYESDDSMNQRICIRRIRNMFTVYLDPDCQEPDGADAKYCFITELIQRSEFEDEYPDADPCAWDGGATGDIYKEWINQDQVRIAEYFEISIKRRELVQLSNGHVGWEDELSEEALSNISSGKLEIVKRRNSYNPTVTWYKASAKEILEQQEWVGRSIPIVRVVGNENDVEGKLKLSGLIRNAKDAMRMYNYSKTAEVECVMLAPKAPYIMEEGQIEDHEDEWKTANTSNRPVLLYKASNAGGSPAPPPQRNQVAAIPAGIVNMAQGAAQDIQATTGIRFDATMNERMNDESGRAVHELRRSGDLGSFHYGDNLNRALRRCGEIIVEIIPKVYDTTRIVTILREDDEEETIQINPHLPTATGEKRTQVTPDSPKQRVMRIFNPNVGKYGVTVVAGPSFATRRIEAAQSLLEFARAVPQAAPYIMDLIAKYQDWEGAEEMALRLARAIQQMAPGIIQPNMKDVDPQTQAVLQQMNQQIGQLNQEKMALTKLLTDQTADRQQRQDKIDKDFEAKLLAIVQKQEASQNHFGSQLKDIVDAVTMLGQSLHGQSGAGSSPRSGNEGQVNGG